MQDLIAGIDNDRESDKFEQDMEKNKAPTHSGADITMLLSYTENCDKISFSDIVYLNNLQSLI